MTTAVSGTRSWPSTRATISACGSVVLSTTATSAASTSAGATSSSVSNAPGRLTAAPDRTARRSPGPTRAPTAARSSSRPVDRSAAMARADDTGTTTAGGTGRPRRINRCNPTAFAPCTNGSRSGPSAERATIGSGRLTASVWRSLPLGVSHGRRLPSRHGRPDDDLHRQRTCRSRSDRSHHRDQPGDRGDHRFGSGLRASRHRPGRRQFGGSVQGRMAPLDPDERVEALSRFSQAIQARAQEFADVITAEVGTPASQSIMVQVFASTMVLDQYVNVAKNYAWQEQRQGSLGQRVLINKQPVGVCAGIVPWNVPLFIAAMKLGPVIATGSTMVLKTAPETPLHGRLIGECAKEAGIPDGVINVVSADRAARNTWSDTPISTRCPSPAPPSPARSSPRFAVSRSSAAPSNWVEVGWHHPRRRRSRRRHERSRHVRNAQHRSGLWRSDPHPRS